MIMLTRVSARNILKSRNVSKTRDRYNLQRILKLLNYLFNVKEYVFTIEKKRWAGTLRGPAREEDRETPGGGW